MDFWGHQKLRRATGIIFAQGPRLRVRDGKARLQTEGRPRGAWVWKRFEAGARRRAQIAPVARPSDAVENFEDASALSRRPAERARHDEDRDDARGDGTDRAARVYADSLYKDDAARSDMTLEDTERTASVPYELEVRASQSPRPPP